jgi:hypothetical protein
MIIPLFAVLWDDVPETLMGEFSPEARRVKREEVWPVIGVRTIPPSEADDPMSAIPSELAPVASIRDARGAKKSLPIPEALQASPENVVVPSSLTAWPIIECPGGRKTPENAEAPEPV